MEILVNNQSVTVAPGATLSDLLAQQGLTQPGYAVAVDNRVVRRVDWATFALSEGMKVTVIRAVCGG